jgi:peptidyl-prolyl cis-trans isomerase A (cyclophilin A)
MGKNCLLLVALIALAAAQVALAAPWRVQFTVATLDGEPGPSHEGTFTMEVHDEWAPLGAARFKELVQEDFFAGVRFFRVIDGFMAQFGIHGNPEIAAKWKEKKLIDDPVKESNKRGYVSFATSGKDTRTTQMFINFGDNSRLDSMGFSPFAKVVEGMEVVDRIFKIGEKPNQGMIQSQGNKYLKKEFPRLTYIKSAKLVDGDKEL